MKKECLLSMLLIMLSTGYLVAQVQVYSPYYEAAFAEGKRLYEQGKYTKAKEYFNNAKECPHPNTEEANEWIGKCDKAIADANASQKAKNEQAAKEKKEDEAARKAYMNIRKIEYCNVDYNGKMLDGYGAVFMPSTMRCLQPRITYNALLDETMAATLFIKIKDPKGKMVTGKRSPSGYTYSAYVTIAPGNGKTLELPAWDNGGKSYSVGTYKLEVWHDDNLIYNSSFKVDEDPKVEKPQPVAVGPVEKKAEIKVVGADGRPLKGAKIHVVGTGRHEETDSDGKRRINLGDSDCKNVEVSHGDYKDKRQLRVCAGNQVDVKLLEPVSKENKIRVTGDWEYAFGAGYGLQMRGFNSGNLPVDPEHAGPNGMGFGGSLCFFYEWRKFLGASEVYVKPSLAVSFGTLSLPDSGVRPKLYGSKVTMSFLEDYVFPSLSIGYNGYELSLSVGVGYYMDFMYGFRAQTDDYKLEAALQSNYAGGWAGVVDLRGEVFGIRGIVGFPKAVDCVVGWQKYDCQIKSPVVILMLTLSGWN